jgi:hypothetical protein
MAEIKPFLRRYDKVNVISKRPDATLPPKSDADRWHTGVFSGAI